MSVHTVVVCEAQVPFVQGGAEYHVRGLVSHLQQHGYETELVSIPFKWYPKDEILAHAAAWRLIDLSEANGRPIDLVIGSKFPSYFVRHPNKVTWLIHQYRAAYELCGTPYSDFDHVEEDVGLRAKLRELDRRMLGECQRLFANARNTAERLHRYNGLEAQPLYHPPRLADRLRPGPYGDYVLSVGRIESVKRVDLAVRAMRSIDEPIRLIVVGDGTQRENVERLAEESGLAGRIQFVGTVDDDTLLDLYSGALAVVYAPFDEDFGYVTLEAFLARKPVITARDSGGTLEFVEPDVNGVICEADPEQIAEAVNRLAASRTRAAAFGDAGFAKASRVSWNGVVEQLVGEPGLEGGRGDR